MSCHPQHADCVHRNYIGLQVTLNGQDATIVRSPDGFADVKALDGITSAEFSWAAVHNILLAGSDFRA